MRSRAVHVALFALGLAAAASAIADDHPLQGDLLRLKDPTSPAGRRFLFRAARDAGIGRDVGDPRAAGATLEVTGVGSGDGATGPIDLPAARWTGLGNPAGSRGFRYLDRSGAVRRAVIRPGTDRGTIAVSGRGSGWPYVVTGPQGPIDVRLTIGERVFCAGFRHYARNVAGRVLARDAPAPDDCTPTSVACGNGFLDGGEDCDDGNTTSGDGCSGGCRLEDASGLCAGVPAESGATLRAVPVVRNLTLPVHVAAPPLDLHRVFVVEQPGRIRIIADGTLRAEPFLAIEDRVACCNERGLLSVAFHPHYASNGRFFVYYSAAATGDIVIARYQVSADPDVADPASEHIVLTIQHRAAGNHNGGQLAFGPDGYLYAGTGDGGGGGDPGGNAQNDAALLGKLLRLDVEVDGFPYYAIPPTNPFAGAGGPREEIWAKGVRNPWRFSFDRGTGDLYVADVGQDAWEEVDVQPAASPGGENYGWNLFEGTHCFPDPSPTCPAPPTGFTMPVTEYDHGEGCSITGGFVYRGCRMPDLHGTYFYSDYCTPFFRTFRGVSGGVAEEPRSRTNEILPAGTPQTHILTFGEDARGELYFTDQDGDVFQIVPAS